MLLFNDKDRIVFTGDSVTDSNRGRPIGAGTWDGVGNGFVRQIDTLLNVCYPENKYCIINSGVGGNSSRDLLNRWQQDVLDFRPDYIVCCIGFNDVWRQFDEQTYPDRHVYIDEYEKNLEEMIKLSKGKKMIFMTPYYIEKNKEDEMRKMMDEYGNVCKKVAEKHGIMCIDLQKEFSDYLEYRYSAFLQWDRVHPGWIGSMIIARAFLRAVGFDRQVI